MTIKTEGLGGYLTKEQAAPIFERAAETSAIMSLGQEVQMGLGGAEVPVFTGNLTAEWVDEAGKKPVSDAGLKMNVMKPSKLVAIVPISNEAIRAAGGVLSASIYNKVGDAFANTVDREVMYGTGNKVSNPLSGTSKSVELGTAEAAKGGTYADIVAAKSLLFADDKDATGILADKRFEAILDGAVDANGRAVFSRDIITHNDVLTYGQAVGLRTVFKRRLNDSSSNTLGFVGDFTQIAWGALSGINIRVSDQGTVVDGSGATISAVQHNVTFLICEAEYGLLVNDADAFVKLTDAA